MIRNIFPIITIMFTLSISEPIPNGGFENGLEGYSTWEGLNITTKIQIDHDGLVYQATEGDKFVQITSTSELYFTHDFKKGDTLTFDWAFITTDYYSDWATFSLGTGTSYYDWNRPDELCEYRLYSRRVYGTPGIISDMLCHVGYGVGDDVCPLESGLAWQKYTYTFESDFSGVIRFGVYNSGDDASWSALLVDNIMHHSVPEPCTFGLMIIGLAFFGVRRIRVRS